MLSGDVHVGTKATETHLEGAAQLQGGGGKGRREKHGRVGTHRFESLCFFENTELKEIRRNNY